MDEESPTVFAAENLFEFMKQIENYDFFKMRKLIQYATNVCVSYSRSDFDTCVDYYKKFEKVIYSL